jgi:hypothetical protein
MQQEKGFIKYIVIIGAIIVAAVLSQQAFFTTAGKDLVGKASGALNGYWAKGANWATNTLYSKVSEEVQNRGEMIQNEINSEKEKISESVTEKVGDYFSGIANSNVNPGKNNSCEANQTSSESSQ